MSTPINWHQYFTYDESAGNLIWKPRPVVDRHSKTWNSNYAGEVAGHEQGVGAGMARYVRVNTKMYRAHRIIWEMFNEPIPDGMVIDHINGNYFDNRLHNLRLATKSQNGMNRPHPRHNKYGLKGVSWCPERDMFLARIKTGDGRVRSKRCKTKGEAAVAYAKMSLMYHGKFSPYYKPLSVRADLV